MGHLVTQFQGQILRDAANNRVRGHASVCGYAPPLPLPVLRIINYINLQMESLKSSINMFRG